ncbi:hypothetical protein SAMN05216548_104131 [Faunimonas pinastri]|uniref:Uncharacterized protein n=1 Tax=Faunimonas pinastri TaxID=1855383 RepID=A0A1H9FIT5_9HYPH|nr:hypothetical protein [Faunimonas pinastri]SEQ37834.1 hypothetical protein SAMN05216548_104131 [Faunimonas pinastri]
MPIRQDLYIALVLAVLGPTLGAGATARGWVRDESGLMDEILSSDRLSETDADSVRTLIAEARMLQADGNENGAAARMAEIVGILRAA